MKLLKRLGLLASSLFLCLGLLEFLLRIFAPLQWIFPVSDWTHQYGIIAYPDRQIVNAQPGHFRYTYTTNKDRLRGKWVSPHSHKRNLLLLGDSNVFGFGVQDNETIDVRFNELTSSSPRMINMGNGGWSLPQAVRRYIDIGREFTPEGIILHMAGNDLEDPVYGINWVAYAKSDGSIGLRDIPEIPSAGRLRKLVAPDGYTYKLIMTSQLALRLKSVFNNHSLPPNQPIEVSSEQVVVRQKSVNEFRYAALLRAFALQLQTDNVRFIFIVNQRDFYGSEIVRQEAEALALERYLELHFVHDWFIPGKDLPKSSQGHAFGAEACEALAHKFKEIWEDTSTGS